MSSGTIKLDHRNVRSVNLEHELESSSPLQGFIAGERELDGVRRFEELCETGPRSRAWSITGPYGAGKSTFAHFLLSLVGPLGDSAESAASAKLSEADEELTERLIQIRSDLGGEKMGFIRAVATADREPIGRAISRALFRGLGSFVAGKRGRKPTALNELKQLLSTTEVSPSSSQVLEVIDKVTRIAPVVIVVDELGKSLEYAAANSHDGDLYLLQQIAERFSASELFQGALMGLQHLAFEDYAVGLSASKRREWRKIQGRFDDVPFVGASGHAARLLGESISIEGTNQRAVEEWESGVQDLLQAVPELGSMLESVGESPGAYPLHPTVVPALIDLAGRYGQHDRSLVSFLASDELGSLPRWLETREESEAPSTFRLSDLYDYFVEGSAGLSVSGEDAARLREVRNRLTEAVSLAPLQVKILKTIGILNLVGRGEFRANFELLTQAVAGHDTEALEPDEMQAAIDEMVEQGLLIYREFADEFRIWQGSDFDVQGSIAAIKARFTQEAALSGPLVEQIQKAAPRNAVVASRHSQETGGLRYFDTRYLKESDLESIDLSESNADGLLLLVLAPEGLSCDVPRSTADGRPVAALVSSNVRGLADAAIDAASALEVLNRAKELEQDVVARQEVRHRAVISQAALRERIDSAFAPENSTVRFFARGAEVSVTGVRGVSETLSLLCDETYTKSPRLFNEMLNREVLTSQGAKTRREIIELMCIAEGEPELGVSGNGPGKSLYDSVVRSTGLHRNEEGVWALKSPRRDSGIWSIWRKIESFFEEATAGETLDLLYDQLKAPPVGAKEGPIPLILAAALLVHRDDVFVFEEQTFLPTLGPEHFERLVKAPHRFSVKKASLVGVRGEVFRQMQQLVGVEESSKQAGSVRNSTMLSVIRPLIGTLHSLTPYAKQTKRVSTVAIAVRTALQTTREPDSLIFDALPRACGLAEEFHGDGDLDPRIAGKLVAELKEALDQLQGAYDDLLHLVKVGLKAAFKTAGPIDGLREDLRARSRHLLDRVIDRKLRAFLLMAVNEDLDDREWLEAVATVLAQKPPTSWTDSEIAVFESAALEVAGPFRRLELLHMEMDRTPVRGFRSSRVTITQPDGKEEAQLLAVDQNSESELDVLVDELLADAESKFGAAAGESVLVLLAEKILSDPSSTIEASVKLENDSAEERQNA